MKIYIPVLVKIIVYSGLGFGAVGFGAVGDCWVVGCAILRVLPLGLVLWLAFFVFVGALGLGPQ